MSHIPRPGECLVAIVAACIVAGAPRAAQMPPREAVLVVSVTDVDGRFVEGLHASDFTIFEDGTRRAVSSFTGGGAPTSLGILWNASGPLVDRPGMNRVQTPMLRFLLDRLDEGGELFLAEYSREGARLLQSWTNDRAMIGLAFGSLLGPARRRDAALYDAIATSVPLVSIGTHPRKVLLVMAGGLDRDTSGISPSLFQRGIRESGFLLYAWTNAASTPTAAECPVDMVCDARDDDGPAVGDAPRWETTARLAGIARDTGGRMESVTTSEDFIAALVRLQRDLRAQYILRYRRPTDEPLRLRTVRVEIADPAFRARVRPYVVN